MIRTKIRNGRSRLAVVENGVLPRPLQRTAPRDVVWNGSGWTIAIFAMFLAAGGVMGGFLLWLQLEAASARAAEIRSAGVYTEAVVTEVRKRRGEEPRVTVQYRYSTVDGREFADRVRLREKDPIARAAEVGSKVRLVYGPSDPGRSWLEGREPGEKPMWLAAVPPLVGLASAVGLALWLRREAQLLGEGRAGLARVVSEEPQAGDGKTFLVTYRWTLPSGASRTAKLSSATHLAEPGSSLALVYDPERPERHSLYPMSLVRRR